MIKSWSYVEEYKELRKKILESIDKTLKSDQIFFGKELKKFEKMFIKHNNLKYGIAVGSGTDALYIALRGLGIGHGDEVITVSHTAVATVAAVEAAGASPVLVDVESQFYTLNPSQLEEVTTSKT